MLAQVKYSIAKNVNLLQVAMELVFGIIIVSPILIKHELHNLDENIGRKHLTRRQTHSIFRNIVQQIMDTYEQVL